jgi:hypothetical protein
MDKKPFLLDKSDAKKFVLILGAGSWFIAITELFNPTTEPPTGRRSWLYVPIYNAFGSHGLVMFWFLLGLFLIFTVLKKDK